MSSIKITLRSILPHAPCKEGLERILKAKPNLQEDEEFDLSDLFETNNLSYVLCALDCLPEHDNLWRKYAVWCARQVQHLMTDERSLKALDVAWAFSEGKASKVDLRAARIAAWHAAQNAKVAQDPLASLASLAARSTCYAWSVKAVVCAACAAGEAHAAADDVSEDTRQDKLKEILEAGHWVD